MIKNSCYIVEDNVTDLNLLKMFIRRIGGLSLIGEAGTYSEAIRFLIENKPEFLFLDIELAASEGQNGFDIIKTLPMNANVVVTTNHLGFAVESYHLGKPVDFLLKPYTFERFQLAVNRAMRKPVEVTRNDNERFVYLKTGRSFQKFFLNNIEYIEAYGIYIKIHLEGEKKPVVVNENLSTIVQYIGPDLFLRVHKSYMVNMSKVTSFDSNHLFVGSFPVPIGRSHRPGLESFLRLFANLD